MPLLGRLKSCVLNLAVLYVSTAPRSAERSRVSSAQPSAVRHRALVRPERCERIRKSATIVEQHGLKSQAVRPKARTEEIIDYKKLPAPVKYEELQRESLSESTPRALVSSKRLIHPDRYRAALELLPGFGI